DRYEKGPVLLRDAFSKVPREAWKWRPAPNAWSVQEILGHCADAEANAAEEKPAIAGFDQDRWAKILDYHQTRIGLALAAADVMRANTVGLLRLLPEEAWARAGIHSERGAYSAEDWLEIYAEHLEKHARQIDRNLAAWRQEETRPGIDSGTGREGT